MFLLCAKTQAATDTIEIKSLYDRCLDFDEAKTDSLCIYADWIDRESKLQGFDKGPVLSLRLRGICYEFQSDFNSALNFYLQSLEAARKLGQVRYIISALNDVAMTYSYIGQPLLAKRFYLQCAELALPVGEVSTVVTTFSNLGATFNQLRVYDSALYFLFKAVELGKPLGDSIDLSTTYNNIGNAYFNKGQFVKALNFFQINYQFHRKSNELGSLWTDHLNMADVYLSTGDFDSARFHANESMKLAVLLKSKAKEADSYSLLSRYYYKMGDFKKAYENMQSWYRLDTALVNGNTQAQIAELQEKYNAKDREAENKLLSVEVERQNYRNRMMMFFAIALGLIVMLITIAFVIKRKANSKLLANNAMILQQNKKLAELNQEKNSLIGIVSHDLGSPFATIQLWGQLLTSESNTLNEEQQKAIQRIMKSANHGQDLIKNILDLEKIDQLRHTINLEKFDLAVFVESILQSLHPVGEQKQIRIELDYSRQPLEMISDKQLVQRIVENLVSNAVKYSPKGNKVWVILNEHSNMVEIEVKDQGVGIEQDELPLLFNKYSKISSRPTNGEPSTGLGLSIVKKIVDELKGSIYCESEIGKGTSFKVRLNKES